MIETPVESAAPIVGHDRRTRLWELAMLFRVSGQSHLAARPLTSR